tara:strand:+ start:7696 stop:9972 length:2277 start_codon:yes stop_codon:yes gene_type:complete
MSLSEIIPIELSNGESIELQISANNSDSLNRIDAVDALNNLEAPVQLTEGFFYEYQLSNGYSFNNTDVHLSGILSPSKFNPSNGRLSPNIYVGTLRLEICDENSTPCGSVDLEVRSIKTDYRDEYQFMLEEITENCTDLLMQYTSPVNQPFDVDHDNDSRTLYQRFAFLKSVLDSEDFWTAVNRITTNPVTSWKQTEEKKDIRSVRKMNRNVIRQLTISTNRIGLPKEHSLRKYMCSIPEKVITYGIIDSVDTPENQFIKYALETFKNLCSDFKSASQKNVRLHREAKLLEEKLEEILTHTIFQEISRPSSLPLNSPVLQRKEGYREVLRVWLMVNLAARLTWNGGEDVYAGGKRDVATLYEYWLFFKLTDLLNELFGIQGLIPENFIEETEDKLGLKLKQGKKLNLKGKFKSLNRNLSVKFSFNRTFKRHGDYPSRGSWTQPMRPDYTLSIWPEDISEKKAEEEELISHIHFDAKYKVKNLTELFGQQDVNLDKEHVDQNRGDFKRVDLLKMHAYRDAIRRTAGAYILYPGKDSEEPWLGFHEIVPGLGAFTMRPNRDNDGSTELKTFFKDVIEHFLNRTSQREKHSYQTYRTFKTKNENQVNELLPEPIGVNRDLIPDETYVLVGFYKSEDHLEWIKHHGLYNARAGSRRGSLRLGRGETEAKFILLHGKNELETGKLFLVNRKGPRIFSKKELLEKDYPGDSDDKYYLVYDIQEQSFSELNNLKFDLRKLTKHNTGRASALPFPVTLADLIKKKV